MSLLSRPNSNAKLGKNLILTYGLSLLPYTQNSKGLNLCPHASKGCASACLATSGRGNFPNVRLGRSRKTELFIQDSNKFVSTLISEIKSKVRNARNKKIKIAFRLNVLSDVDFVYRMKKQGFDITEVADVATFYDYTKNLQKALRYKRLNINYVLAFSRAEDNEEKALKALNAGVNVAAVFSDKLPNTWKGHKVIDGDLTDMEMTKVTGTVLGLKAKGRGRKDQTGFVIQTV